MENNFKNFQTKRLEIFREVVKREAEDNLTNQNLDQLAKKIKDKYDYPQELLPFVKDHIRLAMGLSPTERDYFSNEIKEALNLDYVESPVVEKVKGICQYCGEEVEENDCYQSCKYEAHIYNRNEGPVIVQDKCLSCGGCISVCSLGALADKIEFIPLTKLLKDKDSRVYAAVAPSIVGQFGPDVSMGQLRTAFKLLGFEDMVEVALFADILTIKEAFEFDDLVTDKDDFFLTSCCCPVWIRMVENNYPDLFNYMSPSVSPMILSGRVLKELYKDAKVVFMSPCVAKKSEAKEPELEEAIDFVLTYQELAEIFKALDMNLEDLPADEKDQASFASRVYARTGGVSLSVKTVINRIAPRRLVKLKAKKVDGVIGCKEVLDKLSNQQDIDANFIEGMGCDGGCVGGPKTNISVDEATRMVNEYGEDSLIMTPFDNMNVIKIIDQLGGSEIEDIIEDERIADLLTR